MRVLETKDLTKRFGGLVAVNSVSMHVHQGEIVGLIGAGKSTELDPPTSGNVFLFGIETTGLALERMCKSQSHFSNPETRKCIDICPIKSVYLEAFQ
jgi:branched-chain amino acid transport system ATP-binding protein